MLSKELIIGIFAGVGSSTGWLLASQKNHPTHTHAIYGILGGLAGALAGGIVSGLLPIPKQTVQVPDQKAQALNLEAQKLSVLPKHQNIQIKRKTTLIKL